MVADRSALVNRSRDATAEGFPLVLDGETLRMVNAEQGYRYRQRQRYLQEDDRVEIIRRIEAGEKQSELAREFCVTRAAICNTYKNREDILARSRQVYEAQCARAAREEDEKKKRPLDLRSVSPHDTDAASVSTASVDEEDVKASFTPIEANAPLKIPPFTYKKRRLLVSDRNMIGDFSPIVKERQSPVQTMSPVFEDVVGRREQSQSISLIGRDERDTVHHIIPPLRWPLTTSRREPRVQSTDLRRPTGIRELQSRPAAHLVTRIRQIPNVPGNFRLLCNRLIRLLLEEAIALCHNPLENLVAGRTPVAVGVGEEGYPLLRNYQEMLPDDAIGLVHPGESANACVELSLPTGSRVASAVMLMTSELRSGSSICKSIHALKQRGIREDAIFIVPVFANAHSISRVQQDFPAVRGLVAAIDPLTNPNTFLDRYYHSDPVSI